MFESTTENETVEIISEYRKLLVLYFVGSNP